VPVGEVEDPIGRRCAGAQAVDVVKTTAVYLGSGVGECGGRGIRAGQTEDMMARAGELGNDRGADPAGRAGDENAH
jgi:hypothetical protein